MDTHINAASKLLKKQFPDMMGLQDPVLGTKMFLDVATGDFVQILHNGDLHWVTASRVTLCSKVSICIYLIQKLCARRIIV
jgi:hypothetical protein